MLTTLTKANPDDLFRIPFGIEMPLRDMVELYPEFENLMNGEDETCCLSFYYEKNPTNGYFEFRDTDSELDMANLLEIDIHVFTEGETHESKKQRDEINIALMEFMLQEESECKAVEEELTKQQRKALKKERRAIRKLQCSC